MPPSGAPAAQRRTRRRNEVQRYHQRRQNRSIRDAAEAHDGRLFLFGGRPGSHDDAAAAATAAGALESKALVATTAAAAGAVVGPSSSDGADGPFGAVGADLDRHSGALVRPGHFLQQHWAAEEGAGEEEAGGGFTSGALLALHPSQVAAALRGGGGGGHEHPVHDAPKPVSKLPVLTSAGGAASRLPSSIHVRRVEGVPPLPVEAPIAAGTNVDIPTQNYLTVDPKYNIHRRAPGFSANRKAAMRSLLSSAFAGWQGRSESTLVLSTGEAMRAIFQQAYCHDRPLALQMQRIGPVVVVDCRGEQPTSVRAMREKSLLGKVLYRLEDMLHRPAAGRSSSSGAAAATCAATGAHTAASALGLATAGALALPRERVGALVTTASTANRFSQILRWDIDSLEVLVGVDTPVVVDQRTGTEQVLKLEDECDGRTDEERQREALNCWFDATLANVPQVGIYTHSAGVVKSFEVRKVTELLGPAELRIATVAMNFTSNVLWWLVSQRPRDDGSFALINSFDREYLELFEMPTDKNVSPFEVFLDGGGGAAQEEAADAATAPVGSHPPTPAPQQRCGPSPVEEGSRGRAGDGGGGQAEELTRLHLEFAQLCFRRAQYLLSRGGDKVLESARLLFRSCTAFLQCPSTAGAFEAAASIMEAFPRLVERLLQRRAAAALTAGAALRDALAIVGPFEARLLQAVAASAAAGAENRRHAVRALLLCCEGLRIVVSHALDALDALALALAGDGLADAHHCMRAAVEGLARLELLSGALTERQRALPPAQGGGDGGEDDGEAAEVEGPAVTEAEGRAQGTVVDASAGAGPRSELRRVLAELFGDFVRTILATHPAAMSELARRASLDLAAALDGGAAHRPTTTLPWVAGLPADPLSLSFTALRLYALPLRRDGRLTGKMAHVHLLAGRHHAETQAFAKALEELFRARSLYLSAAEGEATAGPRGAVALAIGDVYMRLAEVKARAAAGSTAAAAAMATPHQPLSIGGARAVSAEEADFLQKALAAYEEGGWAAQQAHALLRRAAGALDAVTAAGAPATAEVAAAVHRDLAAAAALAADGADPQLQLWVEWETLRLFTAAAAGEAPAALAKSAADAAASWRLRLSGSVAVVQPLALTAAGAAGSPAPPTPPREAPRPFDVSAEEQQLQLALRLCVLAEAGDDAVQHTSAAVALLRGVVEAVGDGDARLEEGRPRPALKAVLRCWGAPSVGEWLCRLSGCILTRLLVAAAALQNDADVAAVGCCGMAETPDRGALQRALAAAATVI